MEIYVPTSKRELSLRKQQAYSEFSKVINWGRCNPVKFCEVMFGITLMDVQAWIFMRTWTASHALWLMCRAGGKTVVASAYWMSRLVLIPNYTMFIGATTADQAINSFRKLEDIAMNRIASFRDLTDIFRYEIVSGHTGSLFKHNPAGYTFELFNGSSMTTLTSNEVSARGKRGGVWQDECGFIPRSFVGVCDQFPNVDANFTTGKSNPLIQPPQMPLQLLYTSSASSTSTIFYDKFKAYSKHMMAGDPDYFVCDFDVNFFLHHSTIDGEPIKSHIDERKIKGDIRDDPELADRELFNHFRDGAGKNAVVTEDCLVRNSYTRLPVFKNDTGKRKFIFCYDPARTHDNSILAIFELMRNEAVGYYLDLVNIISMADVATAKKTPLNYIEQLKVVRQAMLDYNGPNSADWENIEIYIDAGAGGGPRSGLGDQLLLPWTDSNGVEHRGIIDPDDEVYAQEHHLYSNNAKILHLIEPRKYKNVMFGALSELSELNLIHYSNYDGHRDFLMMLQKNKNGEEEYDEYKLSNQEKQALVQIELAKTELSYICRFENPKTRTVSYALANERRYTMNDDRAYAVAMGAYALWKIRNEDMHNSNRKKIDPKVLRPRKPRGIRREEAFGNGRRYFR